MFVPDSLPSLARKTRARELEMSPSRFDRGVLCLVLTLLVTVLVASPLVFAAPSTELQSHMDPSVSHGHGSHGHGSHGHGSHGHDSHGYALGEPDGEAANVVADNLRGSRSALAGGRRSSSRDDPDPVFEYLTENLSLAAHVPFDQGTDMQFQRREGPHLRAGRIVRGPRDYAFLGTDASLLATAGGRAPADGIAIRVVDVTDPSAPKVLAEVPCPGYKSDIAIYGNLLLQAVERDAPFYGFEGASSNPGCDPTHDPNGIDVAGAAGVRIFDISDPSEPVLIRFVNATEFGGGGVHNVTVVPFAGLAYLATFTLFSPEPRFVYLDLEDPEFPAHVLPLRSISPTAVNECHDIAVDPVRKLGFCGAFEQGLIWDLTEPRQPRGITSMTNDGIFHYHGMRLAPDGRTLVVGAEQTGPDELVVTKETGVGGNSCIGNSRSGALWFYDLKDPSVPKLLGTFAPSTPMPQKGFCSSHFYNFIPGSDRLVTSWLEGGSFVVDYSNLVEPNREAGAARSTAAAAEVAWFLPSGASFWATYYWHGHLYGLAYGGEPGGGLWVMAMDELQDVEPAPQDEGTSWARWDHRPRSSKGTGALGR